MNRPARFPSAILQPAAFVLAFLLGACAISSDSYLNQLEGYTVALERFDATAEEGNGQVSLADWQELMDLRSKLDARAERVRRGGTPLSKDGEERYAQLQERISEASRHSKALRPPQYPW